MATEVLLPQDILGNRHLGAFGPSAFSGYLPRRKQIYNPNHRQRRKAESRRRLEGSAKAGDGANGGAGSLVMGRVAILRRGESLDSVAVGKGEKERRRRGVTTAAGVISSDAGGDLMVYGTGRLGPEPAAVPRQTRLVGVRTRGERAEVYAGPAFSLSPSPRALPLPSFPSKKTEGGSAASATRDLRRLLRLD